MFLSRLKEPKFFLCDGPLPAGGGPGDARSYREWVWRREDYEARFAGARVPAVGICRCARTERQIPAAQTPKEKEVRVPSEYKPKREPLIKKKFFKRQTHSMGKDPRGEAAAVAGNARQ